jgi:prevent-host-death family protein
MGKVVNIHEAKTHLSRIVDEVARGAEVVIAKAGKPVARLVPVEASVRPKRYGLLKGKIQLPDAKDFNAGDEEIIALFEGR